MRKSLAMLVVISLAAAIFAGCEKKQEPIRVLHWGDVIEMANVSRIIKDIKATTGIDVRQERAPAGNAYMEKLLTQASGGMAPDIVFVEVGNIKPMVDKGLLVDLTPYIENDKDTDFNLKDYYPQMIDRFTIDDKLFVIPRDIAPICAIYYNKNLFDRAGIRYPKDDWNWDDFLKTAQQLTLKNKNGDTVQWGFLDEWTIWDSWVYSNGGSIVDDVKKPAKFTLDTPEAIQAVQFRADLSYKYHVAPSPAVIAATAIGQQGTASIFMNGTVAMFYTGYWKAGYFRPIQNFDWDIVMFPKGPTGKRGFPSGGSGYAITTQCKDKDKAWKVLKRFAGKKGQIDLSSQGGLQPAIISLAESPQFMDEYKPKNKKIMLEAVKYIVFTPLSKDWEEINLRYISPALDRVWSGRETAAQAIKPMAAEVNKDFFTKKK
ncbi:MAG: sugar ABC transporter substrate-binding protein [Spirochaetia bacterium]|nr:sugar ABC transporter substrate-binding protein [Spirochaetia bacterium]